MGRSLRVGPGHSSRNRAGQGVLCDFSLSLSLSLSLTLLVLSAPAQAADPAVTCESGKLKTAGKYASCLLSADAKGVKTNTAPVYTNCAAKFGDKWQTSETKGEGQCPGGTGDETGIQTFLDGCTQSVADALDGGVLPDCPTNLADCMADLGTCNGDLTTCGSNLGDCESLQGLPETGQTTCSNAVGTIVACAGTGQDGDVRAGVARSFTDNGDGTITDHATGLMWEKLSNDASIHDKDDQYTWTAAFNSKIATLNSTSFAGYDDWRLPNYIELQSLINAEAPPVYAEFDNGCIGGCTPATCSCTVGDNYWTSTTSNGTTLSQAYTVRFTGSVYGVIFGKGSTTFVRAVRDVSVPSCGNAIAEGFEECDGIDLDGETCVSQGYALGGTLACSPGCTYDTSACAPVCGNGVADGYDWCDGSDLAGATCETRGFNLGGTLSCSAGCAYDTSACSHQPALPASGQTTSYGTGDDGDVEAGAALTYFDNGDGTVTDTTTGLIWEKKILGTGGYTPCSDETGTCANPHHADNAYTWRATGNDYDGRVVTIFLEQLNNRCDQDTTVSCTVNADCAVPGGACGFAGYQDWRLPNFKELHSIVDAERVNPAVDPAFDGASCGPACTDISDPACSCTEASSDYWSSTTDAYNPTFAWGVYFYVGSVGTNGKDFPLYVRAVRGGS